MTGVQGKLAGNSLSALLFSATGSSGGMGGRLLHAYRGAYVATVIIATLLLVLVVVDYLLRVAQRLRQDGRWGAGAGGSACPPPWLHRAWACCIDGGASSHLICPLATGSAGTVTDAQNPGMVLHLHVTVHEVLTFRRT